MAITFKINEIEFTVSTAAEAESVVREFRKAENIPTTPTKLNGAEKPTEEAWVEYDDPEVVERSLRFLETIKVNSPRSANIIKIIPALRAGSPKAVGAKSHAVNKLLLNMGFRKGSVYRSVKKPNEPRLWLAGANINKAISMLTKEYIALKESGTLHEQGPLLSTRVGTAHNIGDGNG